MDIETLTSFFMWCTIINGALLILWALLWLALPDLFYKTQTKWFPMARETFNVLMYCFIGFFKILFIVFNAGPLVALLIIG